MGMRVSVDCIEMFAMPTFQLFFPRVAVFGRHLRPHLALFGVTR